MTSRRVWWQGDREGTEEQSKSDHQGISQKFTSASLTGQHVLQFGDAVYVGCTGGSEWSGTPMLFSCPPPPALLFGRKPVTEKCLCR